MISAALVVLVVRSRHPFFRSRPGTHLMLATLGVVVATLALPFLPIAPLLGMTPLPPLFLALLGLIVVLYIASAELTKQLSTVISIRLLQPTLRHCNRITPDVFPHMAGPSGVWHCFGRPGGRRFVGKNAGAHDDRQEYLAPVQGVRAG